jgi:hypothetical protein
LPHGGRDLLPQIRAICQPELGWDDARWTAEEVAYLALWERYYGLPARADIPDWQVLLADGRRAKATRQAEIKARRKTWRNRLAGSLALVLIMYALFLLLHHWHGRPTVERAS